MKTAKITKQRLRELVLEELQNSNIEEGAQLVQVPINILRDIITASKTGRTANGTSLHDVVANLEDHLSTSNSAHNAFDATAHALSREE